MKSDISDRFNWNIARVKNLVRLYRGLTPGGAGRRPVASTDILRSAVVLLHASMEEVLRSTVAWKLRTAGKEWVDKIPLVGISDTGQPSKFWLGELVAHRGKSVDAILDESIEGYIGTFTVNNTTDIGGVCDRVGVSTATVSGQFTVLALVFERRHHIVHQADKNEATGKGHHKARPISPETVDVWIGAVEGFVASFLAATPATRS